MQVHAVPEAERAIDNSGRKLPWAYDYSNQASSADQDRREPLEKGPFGRSMRRSRSGASRSRSKTAEPRREEDKVKAENIAAEDAVFGSLRKAGGKDESRREMSGDGDANAAAPPTARTAIESESEPTEVLLWGFGEELQWAAIDFYERVSNGMILEDYDRQPPGQRYDYSKSLGRAAAQRSLSRAAMRKKNRFAGGEHWIKVTFDSRQAAELAIARQPHIIKGYMVCAEPYQGRGPQKDEALFATNAGVQITSEVLPPTFSTKVLGDSPNGSSTVTSATATATDGGQKTQQSQLSIDHKDSPTNSSSTLNNGPSRGVQIQTIGNSSSTASQPRQPGPDQGLQLRRSKIDGATRAVLLPPELAMAPKQPKPSWTSWIGASEIIGSAVPRKDDGSFDWDKASLYWRLFYWLDGLLGTDFCGLKME